MKFERYGGPSARDIRGNVTNSRYNPKKRIRFRFKSIHRTTNPHDETKSTILGAIFRLAAGSDPTLLTKTI
eukprot:CAMPEP_0180198022 /NCGR_PEP_ID=MMETSP0987-20121128/4943_1 /TAXON_ID=697907 /ORGANISM="non described non described, Strain CCMP2293" /LENGTH=70 /DNA_ID=CAMNT_0022152991 /DNA_START=923 /DNA_END=1135 /DNA_ORIENTATION=-